MDRAFVLVDPFVITQRWGPRIEGPCPWLNAQNTKRTLASALDPVKHNSRLGDLARASDCRQSDFLFVLRLTVSRTGKTLGPVRLRRRPHVCIHHWGGDIYVIHSVFS